MSLYDGIGGIDTTVSPFRIVNSVQDEESQDKSVNGPSGSEIANWSSNYKLLQTQIQRRRVAETSKQVLRPKSGVVMPSMQSSKFASQDMNALGENTNIMGFNSLVLTQTKNTINFAVNPSDEPFEETEASLADIQHEYEPLKPNDFDQVLDHRKKYDELGENHIRISKGKNIQETVSNERRIGAAIAPPSSLTADIENSKGANIQTHNEIGFDAHELKQKRAQLAHGVRNKAQRQVMGGGSKIASSIMAKYGWKEGKGLGKDGQGISKALQVEKHGKSDGKILDTSKATDITTGAPATGIGNPSKVILLTNMVGKGEVDDDLEPEIAEECNTYGAVERVLIYELPDAAEDIAVRIFVEFKRQESAVKAAIALNGRYFGGRNVKVKFWDYNKFKRLQLT